MYTNCPIAAFKIDSGLTGTDRRSLLEHSLPVASVLRVPHWWSGALRHSLPVVSWEFCQWGAFRTLTTGSELGISECIPIAAFKIDSVLTGSDRHSLLEHSLPVASVLREVCCRWSTFNLAFFSLRPQRKHKIIPGPMFPNAPLEHSLPVASVLTGSDRHSLLEHYLS